MKKQSDQNRFTVICDGPLLKKIKIYAFKKDIQKAEAVRELIKIGLEAEQ